MYGRISGGDFDTVDEGDSLEDVGDQVGAVEQPPFLGSGEI